jgi:hypothetical protein
MVKDNALRRDSGGRRRRAWERHNGPDTRFVSGFLFANGRCIKKSPTLGGEAGSEGCSAGGFQLRGWVNVKRGDGICGSVPINPYKHICTKKNLVHKEKSRATDIHPNASIGTVVRAMSCRRRSRHPPFPRPLGATQRSWEGRRFGSASECVGVHRATTLAAANVRSQPRKRKRGDLKRRSL